uniref:Uncharacterized protein n=1 Tax=Arundo donax TaxID=35708 RepID=A0A0A9BJ47_ARUDO
MVTSQNILLLSDEFDREYDRNTDELLLMKLLLPYMLNAVSEV